MSTRAGAGAGRMATIYEVAKLAGVSPATVSRVFNGVAVSDEKLAAVREAARQLKFTPNRTARTLRKQESEVIALVIPDIENPYFTELARGVEDVAQKAGYSVVLCNTDSQLEKEATYLQIAISEHMAGVILAAASDTTNLDDIQAAGRPVVAVDRGTGYDIDGVVMANRMAGQAATEHLVRAGYRRIACITGPRLIETAYERAQGWRAVIARQFPDADPDELLRYSTFRVDGGREVMEELLELPEPPDAMVAGNNLLGVGAIQVLTERGLTPPKLGVAVVGSLPFTTLSPSAVTLVRLPARHMGVTAAKMLLERIAGDDQPARTVVLRGELQPARPAD
ncbi:LacI family DNA-binding transcriptional regulator [Agromyces italicus]|uniref:LacI family DNA-binding transcriptional regulator n=1 Tax=Agromyces italicus TaxID=279572 RepID=UPI001FDF6334|nr:LacI family DNA-binding transcriptional regulator [Agromyces italicus]